MVFSAVESLLDRGREQLSTLSSLTAGMVAPKADSGGATVSAASHVRRLPAAGTVPPPRESHSITPIGARLYVFGGFDGARVLNDLYVFDLHSGLWAQLVHTGISPPARAGHSATALGVPAHLIVFGGANSSRRFADVQLFDTADNHWQKPPVRGRAPAPRYYHSACLARGALLIFGGNDGAACLADLHALNTESWGWSQPVTSGQTPPPRCGHTGTLVNKLLFVVGGAADAAAVPALAATGAGVSSSGEFTDVHVLDTESWSWWRPDVGPSPLPPIAYHSACLIADKIFLFGGSTRDAIYNDVLMLETSTSHWQVVEAGGGGGGGSGAALPRRRRLGAARGSGTRLLLFGGWDGTHTCADLLEVDTSRWLRIDGTKAPASSTQPPPPQPPQHGGRVVMAEVKGTRPPAMGKGGGGGAGGGQVAALPGGGGGFGSELMPFGGGGVGGGDVETAIERLEMRHEEELQRMRGEVARLRMSNELMAREMAKLKALVGTQHGGGGNFDVDALASRREIEELKGEVQRLRRKNAQERDADAGAMRAEMDALKRMVNALSMRVTPDIADDAGRAPPGGDRGGYL